jgi:hypothetical protein
MVGWEDPKGMADHAVDDGAAARKRRRRAKSGHRRKNRKRQRLFYNLGWLLGGLAIGLPLLALMLLFASRY